ncbi:ABC transporter substrate-binding protein [Pectinatus sottacetonis]|uniref:ABC transporter substrate-binding protein n=1 Tax=Pectinatus sottacetonis TaxID=1002795 RepID=UPI0018C54134|nr:ABC transporter substrate-binding protein [Pectinatus sottacetonis]
MNRRFLLLIFSLVFVSINILGCAADNKKQSHNILYTVTDTQGSVLNFSEKPHRIVSLSISTDEILLGLLPPDRILAVTALADDKGISNVRAKAKKVSKRIPKNSSAEYILSLQPDLVIVPDFIKPEMIRNLQDIGLKVYVYKTPHTIDGIKKCINDLAVVVGEPQNAAKLITYMNKKLQVVQKKLGYIPVRKRKRVVFMRYNGVYFSKKTSFSDIFRNAGLYDVTDDIKNRHEGILPREEVVKLKPDIFIMADWNYDGKHDVYGLKEQLLSDRAYENIPAWQYKKIIIVPGAEMLCISQYAADAVLDLAQKAYPEKFY